MRQFLDATLSGRATRRVLMALAATFGLMAALPAAAVPIYARQTGQNCVACHAGGQFPELTAYGRYFKMTGYTIGAQTVPLAGMVVASVSRLRNTNGSADPAADSFKNNELIPAAASLFVGGRITDNVGAFTQITFDPYAVQNADGSFSGHTSADNVDIRYADHLVAPGSDLIWGVSLNNNPSVSDPWNTAPAWMQYVPVPSPSSSRFIDGNTPYPGMAAGGNIAGVTAYALWQNHWYGEIGTYRSANGLLHPLRQGVATADMTALSGLNPYWRLAYTRQWGAHDLMVGTSGMRAAVFDDPTQTSDSTTLHHYLNLNLDAQYQYLLDPHAITAQLVYGYQRHRYPDAIGGQAVPFVTAAGAALAPTSTQDTTQLLRAKLSYVYQAKYGGAMSVFSLHGSSNTANLTAGYDPGTLTITADPNAAAPSAQAIDGNATGRPDTRGWTAEVFWMPIQYLRLGAQYTAYSAFNGAGTNYNGFGRNARDNNSLFVYAWLSY